MNYMKLFYWLTVADNAKTFFVVFVGLFTFMSVVATICYFVTSGDSNDQRMSRKWMWWCYPFMIFFWSLFIFTPSKRDALIIVAGGSTLNYLTTDSTTKQIPKELSNFVLTEIKNMAAEAKVELQSGYQKEKILEEAKNMTGNQIIEKMRVDSTFKKVILNQ